MKAVSELKRAYEYWRSDMDYINELDIATPKQAHNIAAFSDGIIAGNAIAKLVARYGKASAKHVSRFVKEIKSAIVSAENTV